MAPVLETRKVTKRFPGVLANDRIDFSLEKGEVLAFLREPSFCHCQVGSGLALPTPNTLYEEGNHGTHH